MEVKEGGREREKGRIRKGNRKGDMGLPGSKVDGSEGRWEVVVGAGKNREEEELKQRGNLGILKFWCG